MLLNGHVRHPLGFIERFRVDTENKGFFTRKITVEISRGGSDHDGEPTAEVPRTRAQRRSEPLDSVGLFLLIPAGECFLPFIPPAIFEAFTRLFPNI